MGVKKRFPPQDWFYDTFLCYPTTLPTKCKTSKQRAKVLKMPKNIQKSKGNEIKASKSWVYPVDIVPKTIWYTDTRNKVPHGAKCCPFAFGVWCLNHRCPPHATVRPTGPTEGLSKKAWPSLTLSPQNRNLYYANKLSGGYVCIMHKELGDWLTVTAHSQSFQLVLALSGWVLMYGKEIIEKHSRILSEISSILKVSWKE